MYFMKSSLKCFCAELYREVTERKEKRSSVGEEYKKASTLAPTSGTEGNCSYFH